MRKSRYTEEQIVNALKQADAGMKVEDICRKLGITPTTFYRWKAKFGGMEVNEARRLKQLEEENRRLKLPRTTISWDTQLRHDGRGKVYRWESRSPEKSVVDSPPSVRRMRSFASFVARPSTSFHVSSA